MSYFLTPKTHLQVIELGDLSALSAESQLGLQNLTTANNKSVFIAGAGCVGLAQALAFLNLGYQVILHDPKALTAWQEDKLDLKVFAVNHVNASFLETIGGWAQIQALRCNPYDQLSLHVGEQEQETLFTAAEVNLDKLGYMVENSALVQGLLTACQSYGSQFIFLNQVELEQAQKQYALRDFSIANDYAPKAEHLSWLLSFKNGLKLKTNLVLAADGVNSFWRQQAKIGVDIHSYPTRCMLIQVETNPEVTGDYAHLTWQQVDEHGPKAWLPVNAGQGVLCWYDQIHTIEQLQKLPLTQLKNQVLANFPVEKIGTDFTITQVASFPLARQRAQHYWHNNVILLGDAAHTVSPLAGQGLNLGLQDVQCLTRLFADPSFTSLEALALAYARERFVDNTLMQEFLSSLHHLYISRSPIAKVLRENMYRINGITSVKHYALNYANGDRKLLRGLSDVSQSLLALLGKK
ncbi:FAD-dependent monooxygenase [Psittacicella gerlachiana]|uniref:FAD-binding domain-containing protein n=1 Tax=Psittacicella gerlachiana TaxID=2028574 RepID=A0A3A1YBL2_9GAMM|nr:FAD-dependent monooxygenase [Psittacicella gerlachiana]RIY34578.1 hypothetical protein CKF59_05355 [Psittacicella gerlachiana]